MILFGGWGGGIRNDLYILKRTPEVSVNMQWFLFVRITQNNKLKAVTVGLGQWH